MFWPLSSKSKQKIKSFPRSAFKVPVFDGLIPNNPQSCRHNSPICCNMPWSSAVEILPCKGTGGWRWQGPRVSLRKLKQQAGLFIKAKDEEIVGSEVVKLVWYGYIANLVQIHLWYTLTLFIYICIHIYVRYICIYLYIYIYLLYTYYKCTLHHIYNFR